MVSPSCESLLFSNTALENAKESLLLAENVNRTFSRIRKADSFRFYDIGTKPIMNAFRLLSGTTQCRIAFCSLFLFTPFLLLAGCEGQGGPKVTTPPPPPEVLVTEVVQQDVPIYFEWIGTTEGNVNAQIRPRVQGSLQLRDYREGSLVKTGQLMFAIDPREYQAALNQAMGDLRRAEANLGKTRLDVARYTPLAKKAPSARGTRQCHSS
jgi:hypothetical protein